MTRKNLELNDISALDFTTQCIRIADAYSNDTSSVGGSVFAHLAKQLIARETQPGGPYNDENDTPTVQLNAAIGRLFLLMHTPLPNVDNYLMSTVQSTLSDADSAALARYVTLRKDSRRTAKKQLGQHASYRRAAKTLNTLDEPVKSQALQFLERIKAADTITHEIAAISHFTGQAFAGVSMPPAKISALGEANVHAWIAYTMYDHILDNDADTTLLPAANICMRIALNLYKTALPVRHPLQAIIAHYFDQVDIASAWEITSCRAHIADELIHIDNLPDYQRYEVLAWRSCIHILGPLIVAAPPSLSDTHAAMFTKGLHHYLIARQLGDDIHDWRADLSVGRISAVVALLLERQNVQSGSTHELNTLIATIQKDFLSEGAIVVSELILHHAKTAHEKLIASGCDPSSELIGLALRLERMAQESIHQQRRFVSFQDEYNTKLTD